MERLSGLDAGFLYMETPTLHMHTLKVAVLAPDDGPGPLPTDLDTVRAGILARIPRMPGLAKRLVEVPLRLHHPVWIVDPDLDIAAHVHEVRVPAPGWPEQMDEVVADIAGRPLDRRRPLWEMHLLTGLAGGRIGVVVKIHHAVADGVAAAAMLANVAAGEPDGGDHADLGAEATRHHPEPALRPEPLPSAGDLLRDAFVDHLRQLAHLPALVVRTFASLVATLRHLRRRPVRTPRPMLDAPRTPLNGALVAGRSFASVTLPLPEVKAVKDAFGVTVNDVVLALVGTALREELRADDDLPERSLIASVPMATDGRGRERGADPDVRLAGNRVSSIFTTLATDQADAVARLLAIHEVTSAAKTMQGHLGPDLLRDWVQFTPPGPYAWTVRQYSRWHVADRLPPPINVVVSNVPGSAEPIVVAGARLLHLFSVGPILEGIGLNVTAWSYRDQLDVGILAAPGHGPDPHRIADALRSALQEYGRCSPGVHLGAGDRGS